jgi:hypothetical protein
MTNGKAASDICHTGLVEVFYLMNSSSTDPVDDNKFINNVISIKSERY